MSFFRGISTIYQAESNKFQNTKKNNFFLHFLFKITKTLYEVYFLLKLEKTR